MIVKITINYIVNSEEASNKDASFLFVTKFMGEVDCIENHHDYVGGN